jgi:L-methionine (R)-S-oxide reductase
LGSDWIDGQWRRILAGKSCQYQAARPPLPSNRVSRTLQHRRHFSIICNMLVDPNNLVIALQQAVSTATDRIAALQGVAELIKSSGDYRWVGLYDVDHAAGTVTNIVWAGPGVPEYPTFPITKGLTASPISSRKTVNVGDVDADPRYLTAFGTTKSEIIVPVLDRDGEKVLGTIDVESEVPSAFSEDVQVLLESCSKMVRPLWQR